MKYSIIVPVYNRPDEVDELLESLMHQTFTDFEIIIVEDGSRIPCKEVCTKYNGALDIKYYQKDNSGPGQSRNYGAERASGVFLLILDSDVVLPEGYLQAIEDELKREDADAFGGPDAAHSSFTDTQKAISYSMTSFFTTGGIRGKTPSNLPEGRQRKAVKALDKFYPRSFNMGIRKEVYERLGGFSKMRFGEDIDFSIRIFKAGCRCRLFPEAWVWHKRRTDFRKFWRQVFNSGIARINLYKKYPESLKLVHMLPAVFTLGVAFLLVVFLIGLATYCYGEYKLSNWSWDCATIPANIIYKGQLIMIWALVPLILYSAIIGIDSAIQNKSLKVGLLSIPAAFVQLGGYGCGFLSAWWKRCVCGKDEFQAYEKTFYK